MHKEHEMILACSCFSISNEQQTRVEQLLLFPLDWEYINRFVITHNVANLVYRNIKNASAGVDSYNAILLRNVVLQNDACSLFQTGNLLKLLTVFEKESILAVPFKGPVLSQILYDDPAVRSYGDLDILISIDDVLCASRLLAEQGFIPEIELAEAALAVYMRTEDNIIFYHPESHIIVELHWELSGQYLRFPLGLDCFRKNLQVIQIVDWEVNSLSVEDILLYLCIHGSKHVWSRLEWLCCVAELVKSRKDMDWDSIFDRAAEFECRRMVYLGLALSAELLDTKLPGRVWERLNRDNDIAPLCSIVKRIIFPEDGAEQVGKGRFSRFHLQNRDSLQDSVRYCCRLVFQPTFQEWKTWPLPANLSFLYHIFRPCRLAWGFMKRQKGADLHI